jgi:hypothetical protein
LISDSAQSTLETCPEGTLDNRCLQTALLHRTLTTFLYRTNTLPIGEMDKTKITGDKNVDAIQDGVNEGVTGQLGKGGVLEGVGNLTSKEVFTRSERGGKNESGKHGL